MREKKWPRPDLNWGPHDYQSCAQARLSYEALIYWQQMTIFKRYA